MFFTINYNIEIDIMDIYIYNLGYGKYSIINLKIRKSEIKKRINYLKRIFLKFKFLK